jgi:CheY-like chemotaxis protein
MQPTDSQRVRRVLVVDDEPDFAALMTDVLATLPERLEVAIAGNGQAAIEAVRRDAPDLVVLDVNMPVMNGLEALKHIHQMDPRLPVLLVTATDCRSVSQGLTTGAFGYLPKPMDIRYVGHLVGLALRSRDDDARAAAGRRG